MQVGQSLDCSHELMNDSQATGERPTASTATECPVIDEAFEIKSEQNFAEIGPLSIEEARRFLKSIPVEISNSFRGRVDRSDLVQDVLLKITEKEYGLGAMPPPQQRAFLRRMLVNRVTELIRSHLRLKRDARRERPLEREVPGPTATPIAELIWNENQSELTEAMSRLPVDYQTVLRLRHHGGLSFVQIGQTMNRSADAVRVLWGRAVVQLTKQIGES